MRRTLRTAAVGATAVTLAGYLGCSPPSGSAPRTPRDDASKAGPVVVIAAVDAEASTDVGKTPGASYEGDEVALDGCKIVDLIEDGENDDNQLVVHNGRSGYIYSFADVAGTTLLPSPGTLGGVFTMSPGGAEWSLRALRIHGRLANASIIFAGLGLNFLDPRDQYDASAYDGVTFYAKADGDVTRVRFGLMDVNTDPDGAVCTSCFNFFGANLTLSRIWQRHTLRFAELHQLPGWGEPRPPHLEQSKLYGATWQVSDPPGGSYDVRVDDFAFVKCR